MGAGPPEYRILVEQGSPRFAPDLVLVNLFAGNDPPDLHRHVHDRSPVERALRRSYTWTFAKNLVRARGGLREARLPARVPGPARARRRAAAPPSRPARWRRTIRPLVGPVLSEAAYEQVLAFDLGRFYRAVGDPDSARPGSPCLRSWTRSPRPSSGRGSRWCWRSCRPCSRSTTRCGRRPSPASRLGPLPGAVPADIDPRLPNSCSPSTRGRAALPHADLTPAFADASRREGSEALYKRRDNHWTPHGNRLAAGALVDFLAPLVRPDDPPVRPPPPGGVRRAPRRPHAGRRGGRTCAPGIPPRRATTCGRPGFASTSRRPTRRPRACPGAGASGRTAWASGRTSPSPTPAGSCTCSGAARPPTSIWTRRRRGSTSCRRVSTGPRGRRGRGSATWRAPRWRASIT